MTIAGIIILWCAGALSRDGVGGAHGSKASAILRTVLPAIRIGLASHPAASKAFLSAGYEGLSSRNAVGVRHAIAVAAAAASSDPGGAVKSCASKLEVRLFFFSLSLYAFSPPHPSPLVSSSSLQSPSSKASSFS